MQHYDLDTLMSLVGKGQMTRVEYEYISQFLGKVNLLVFGTGHDTPYWRSINKGTNIFLEHDEKWISPKSSDTLKVKYNTIIKKADYYLTHQKELVMDLPKQVTETHWDVIFVDAPPGNKKTSFGRMQSIYTAYTLSTTNTDIFVHDCNRYVEQKYTSHFFEIHKELTKLRHCKKRL